MESATRTAAAVAPAASMNRKARRGEHTSSSVPLCATQQARGVAYTVLLVMCEVASEQNEYEVWLAGETLAVRAHTRAGP